MVVYGQKDAHGENKSKVMTTHTNTIAKRFQKINESYNSGSCQCLKLNLNEKLTREYWGNIGRFVISLLIYSHSMVSDTDMVN